MFTDEVVISNTPLTVDGSGVTQPVSGTVNVGNTVPVSGPLTDTQLRATPVPVSASVTFPSSAVAVVSQVVLTGNTNATLLATNPARVGLTLFVPSQPVYIKFGSVASSTSFSIKVTANNTQLTSDDFKRYTGRIDILAQNGQTVTVTEY